MVSVGFFNGDSHSALVVQVDTMLMSMMSSIVRPTDLIKHYLHPTTISQTSHPTINTSPPKQRQEGQLCSG
jgi:hypothetical protein